MKAYKGFTKDMQCRGFQFMEGETYHEDNAKLCEIGFHACENPIDCFKYYSPCNSVYHEVELDDVAEEKDSDDSKICGKTIKIGAKLDIAGICKAHFEYVKSKTTTSEQGKNNTNLSAQDRSSLSAQDYSSLSAQDCSSLSAGENSVIAAFNSKAKGGINTLIALANRQWDGEKYIITDFKAAIVDGIDVKPDTWYELKDGEFVEVSEEVKP